jgi:hypothetical protein
MRIFYYIRRFWEIPRIEKHLLIKGLIFCFIYKLILKMLPLRTIWPLISNNKNLRSNLDIRKLGSVIKTMRRIQKIKILNYSCLVRSLTFRSLNYSIGANCVIVLEIIKTNKGFSHAHAYVTLLNYDSIYLRKERNNRYEVVCIK